MSDIFVDHGQQEKKIAPTMEEQLDGMRLSRALQLFRRDVLVMLHKYGVSRQCTFMDDVSWSDEFAGDYEGYEYAVQLSGRDCSESLTLRFKLDSSLDSLVFDHLPLDEVRLKMREFFIEICRLAKEKRLKGDPDILSL